MCILIGLCNKHIHYMIRKYGLETVHFKCLQGLTNELEASKSCTVGIQFMLLLHLSSQSNRFSLETFHLVRYLNT